MIVEAFGFQISSERFLIHSQKDRSDGSSLKERMSIGVEENGKIGVDYQIYGVKIIEIY